MASPTHGRMPRTYAASREAFLRVAADVGRGALDHRTIDEPGPDGEELSIDTLYLGPPDAERALVVLSGVHGVEGFASAEIQRRTIRELPALPDGAAAVFVHAVNPYGMAWWRRANEHNVDLNRNWARDRVRPPRHEVYDLVHELLCPTTAELPPVEPFLDALRDLAARHGPDVVEHAITDGQYHRPDGLYYGGTELEPSLRHVGGLVRELLPGATRTLAVDLHTGLGANGTFTLLAPYPPGSDQDRRVRATFAPVLSDANTVRNTVAEHRPRPRRIVDGLAEVLPPGDHVAITFELGTVSGPRMIAGERAEHWVHRFGDRADPAHAAAIRTNLENSTPDDPDWERFAISSGRAVVAAALTALR